MDYNRVKELKDYIDTIDDDNDGPSLYAIVLGKLFYSNRDIMILALQGLVDFTELNVGDFLDIVKVRDIIYLEDNSCYITTLDTECDHSNLPLKNLFEDRNEAKVERKKMIHAFISLMCKCIEA